MKKGISLIETTVSSFIFCMICCLAFSLIRMDMLLLSKTNEKMSDIMRAENLMERQIAAPYVLLTSDAYSTVIDLGRGLKSVTVDLHGIRLYTLRSKDTP